MIVSTLSRNRTCIRVTVCDSRVSRSGHESREMLGGMKLPHDSTKEIESIYLSPALYYFHLKQDWTEPTGMPSSAESHVRGCILYLFMFMSIGSVNPFLPLIWRSLGFSEHEVGVLGAVRPVVSFFAAPIVCAFAERHGIQQKVLYGLLLLYGATRPTVLFAGMFLAAMVAEASCSFFSSPILSLIDSAVRHAFGSGGYGTQRMWGAVGYGIAAFIGGYTYDATGGSYGSVMVVFAVVLGIAFVAATGVPVGQNDELPDHQEDEGPREKADGDGDGDGGIQATELGERKWWVNDEAPESTSTPAMPTQGPDNNISSHADAGNAPDQETRVCKEETIGNSNTSEEDSDSFGEAARDEENKSVLPSFWELLGSAHASSFFVAVVLSGMGAGVIDTFLFIRLEELGGSHLLFGVARFIMCVAEVPFFYLSGPLIRRIGPRSVAALAQVAYIIRFIYYSVLEEPWWVLPAEVLHGLTFAAMWAATTDYAYGIAPVHLRTTVLGVVAGLHRGLGCGLGSLLGGVLYAGLGARLCFRASSVFALASLLLLALFSQNRQDTSSEGNRGGEHTGEQGLEGWGEEESHRPPEELRSTESLNDEDSGQNRNGVDANAEQ